MHRLDWLVISLVVFQGMLAIIVVGSPEDLGIPPVLLNWLAVCNVGVGLLLNQLKSLGSEPRDVPPQKPANEEDEPRSESHLSRVRHTLQGTSSPPPPVTARRVDVGETPPGVG